MRTPVALDDPDLVTPALVVDLAVLEQNLAAMATAADRAGLALRPHAKTHKCVPVAHRQLALGAVGLSVATVAEAEVFADHGVRDLFVAYPVWADGPRARRLAALAERCRLRVGVDSVAGAGMLGRVRAGAADPLEVLIEIDCGHHRSGVAPTEAPAVATAAGGAGLAVVGVFSFPGHAYAPGAPDRAARDEAAALAEARERLAGAGFAADVVSGGSTPTMPATLARATAGPATLARATAGPAAPAAPGPLTELRPGVYAFNDAQQVRLGTCPPDAVALFALATVVSTPAPGRLVLDAGSKVLGTDRPPWMEGYGLVCGHPGVGVGAGGWAVVASLSEHHAVVTLPPGGEVAPPAVGDRVRIVPNHVCSAVNLADELLVVVAGRVVDRWPVVARGANT